MAKIPKLCAFIFVLVIANCLAQKTALDDPQILQILRRFYDWGYELFGGRSQSNARRLLKAAENMQILQERIDDRAPFPCNVIGGRSQNVPKSVHELRPGDIDVIAGVGDSLTAGFGLFATDLLHVSIANRGAALTAGGQGNWRKYLTLPNIIKEFNPQLFGYALADSPSHNFQHSQFNVGELGAMSTDMPFMGEALIRRMKDDPRVDINNHWKLISVFIGHNDFCSNICYVTPPWSTIDAHRKDMINLLRVLRDNLPRTFVLLMPPTNLKSLVDADPGDRWICNVTRSIACPCLFGLKYRNLKSQFFRIMSQWLKVDEEIATLEEFQREDFAVVSAPASGTAYIPKLQNGKADFRFFSSDCFHVSQRAQAAVANAVWNNLLEPVGKKTVEYPMTILQRFLCPTQERPYLVTWKNMDGRELSKYHRA